MSLFQSDSTKTISVLVVDDSTFARRAIIRILSEDSRLVVIGEARDGEEALRMLAELKVDVVTLDLEMPGVSGLETLEHLQHGRRVPVVVFSTATERGAAVTLQALLLGAFDVVAKPQGDPLKLHSMAHNR